MASMEEKFVWDLVEVEPDLEPLLREHVSEFDELLPNLFLGDVARWIRAQVESGRSTSSLAPFFSKLEDGFGDGRSVVSNLIAASFVENVFNYPRVVALFGPKLSRSHRVFTGQEEYRSNEVPPMPQEMMDMISRARRRKGEQS